MNIVNLILHSLHSQPPSLELQLLSSSSSLSTSSSLSSSSSPTIVCNLFFGHRLHRLLRPSSSSSANLHETYMKTVDENVVRRQSLDSVNVRKMVMGDRALHRVMRRGRGRGGRGPPRGGSVDSHARLSRRRKEVEPLQAENGGVIDKISALEWDKVALKQERRITIRTWRTRVRDRVRYFRGVVQ
ncbi:hypothetical protein L6452_37494 [Arctium lappa]|uniref:Uncharacterized protein n=1 Tax=Arctium lappa TaxID=4217 RepID=A0ACB8Y7B1_ARCLA|nr:hypothetical protein L6452_37494 [Arctium lappa]